MTSGLPRHFKIVAIVHFSIVAALVLSHFVQRFLHRHRKHEMITYVTLSAPPAPPPTVFPVQEVIPPEPLPTPPPEVVPPPPPPPKAIPKPPKKKKVIKKSTKRIKKKPPPEKPKPKPSRPRPDVEDILRKTIQADQKVREAREAKDAIPSWYYKVVRQTMYDAWTQPSSLASTHGIKAIALIRVHRDGVISLKELVVRSGNRTMDDSVMEAVYSVKRLKPLPSGYVGESKDITIEFEVTH